VLISESNVVLPAPSLTPIPEPTAHNPPETASRLERMAHQLAGQHVIGALSNGHARHLTRLPHLAQQLQDAHQHLVNASAQDLASSTAAEWLLDNYYMVVQTLRQIKEDLPESYYRQLPKLAADTSLSMPHHAGLPRIYAAAYAFWTHEEYQLDQGRLIRFVTAYQQVDAFTSGELWAVPTMLRLTLLETLSSSAK
jgi:cyclic beta-1,2-glucan synthetase